MSLALLFHFLCAQHVSDINISIIMSLRLFCWFTTLVVLYLVRCVLEFRCSWVGVVSMLQASACNMDTTPTQPHRNSNIHRTKNNTTNVMIQENNRKLLMMDILISETCWAHKKWNKIASDIKLVFYSSTSKTEFNMHCIALDFRFLAYGIAYCDENLRKFVPNYFNLHLRRIITHVSPEVSCFLLTATRRFRTPRSICPLTGPFTIL